MEGFGLYLVLFWVSLDIPQEDVVSDTVCSSIFTQDILLVINVVKIQGLTPVSTGQKQLCVHWEASAPLPLEGWSLLRVLPREHTLVSASRFLCVLPYVCHDQK